MSDQALRAHLVRILDWEDAHAGFDHAVAGLPARLRGVTPPGWTHSAWQLLEHIRIAQHDILDFSRNPNYAERAWPDEYWPETPEPPTAEAWDESVSAFRRDRDALKQLTTDSTIGLTDRIPHGSGQTYLREVLLVLDHNAYHVAELVVLRRLLGAWTT